MRSSWGTLHIGDGEEEREAMGIFQWGFLNPLLATSADLNDRRRMIPSVRMTYVALLFQ